MSANNLGRMARTALAIEQARIRLATVVPPGGLDAARAEVRRRCLEQGGLLEAYTSVADDITSGQWKP